MDERTRKRYESVPEELRGTPRGLLAPDVMATRRRRLCEALLTSREHSGGVLDVGCGYGDYSALFVPEHYTGLEPIDWIFEEAKRRNPASRFEKVALEDYEGPGADTVLCLGMISGLADSELARGLSRLKSLAGRTLLLEFQSSELYRGTARSRNPAEVEVAMQPYAQFSGWVTPPGDTVVIGRFDW